jgi:hypothetical protein
MGRKAASVGKVLSVHAVHVRVHRIMQRLQAAALALGTKTDDSNRQCRPNLADPTEKTLAAMKHFSLKHSADFLPISKSRRQPSLDISLDEP